MRALKGPGYSLPRRLLPAPLRRPGILRYLLNGLLLFALLEMEFVYRRLWHAHQQQQQQHTQVVRGAEAPVRVYIASLHWNSEAILREFWNQKVLDLVRELGPSNVFVSVHESGSWDLSKEALHELDEALGALGAARGFTLDETTHADEIASAPSEPGNGWVRTAKGEMALRRIPYLARLRNQSLRPLLELAKAGTTFDYVLFLGDVYFEPRDVLDLLSTNNGSYAAACSLDFSRPPQYYDTFALRDAEGFGTATQTWPYFVSPVSRAAAKQGEMVPVSSCWNGIVSMPASAFTGSNALSFRGVSDAMADKHLEGSECCLIHADNRASRRQGVYLNPYVRVGYSSEAYHAVHPRRGIWLSRFRVLTGLWGNRLARWLGGAFRSQWIMERRWREWQRANPADVEPGKQCLINEMQILVENGWIHV